MIQPPRNAPPADPRVARALDAVAPRDAPDEGTVLHRARRGDGTELRVSLHSYNGHPFLRVGLWQPPRAGEGPWWPVKGRSVTVRMREALGVSGALARAVGAAEGDDAGG